MPKKYPWQRWPDKKKKQSKSHLHSQSSPSPWRKSSVDDVKSKSNSQTEANKYFVKQFKHYKKHPPGGRMVVTNDEGVAIATEKTVDKYGVAPDTQLVEQARMGDLN